VIQRVLVAVDGSDPSLKAVKMAAEVAQKFGAKLTLVHVVPRLLLPPDVYGLTIATVEREHRTYAEGVLKRAVEAVNSPVMETSTEVLFGAPAECIAEKAAAADVGLVVLGSRGHGTVARVFLGSVTDRVAHICTKPVLIVH